MDHFSHRNLRLDRIEEAGELLMAVTLHIAADGYLKLSLVSCPIALFPATSEREKVSFHQIHKETGNRIKYKKVDAETGDEVEASDIIKGYEVGKGQYLEVLPEELEDIQIESKRTIDIDEFVPRKGNRRTLLQQPVLHRA